jgi:hypothetical protein
MKSILTRIIILSFLTFITINSLQAATERRLALVIGNSNYTFSPLKNPVHDATDMAESLKKLGFNVVLKTDASKRDMGRAVEDFGKRLMGGDVGLFYYAGHGMQVSGVNYLIPVNASINEETDVEYEAIDAGRILATMYNAKSRINIVILDACRDNPYVRSFRSATRGLAIISKAPAGTIISYSTSPGDVALDGKVRNSPYTFSLLQYMKEPGLKIEEVFKNVRQKLSRETGGRQIPWEMSSLQEDFYFVPGWENMVSDPIVSDNLQAKQRLLKQQRKLEEQKRQFEEEQQSVKQEKELIAKTVPLKTIRVVKTSSDARYFSSEEGIITDTKTDLEWYMGPDKETNWYEAKKWVTELSISGGGWRMPTILDLKSLYESGKGIHNLDPIFQTTACYSWSDEFHDSWLFPSASTFHFNTGDMSDVQASYRYFCARAFAVRPRK